MEWKALALVVALTGCVPANQYGPDATSSSSIRMPEMTYGDQPAGKPQMPEDRAPSQPTIGYSRGQGSPLDNFGVTLVIFGGEDHDVFLGCLTCDEYDSASVFNRFGSFGDPYSNTSIFNRFSDYGSKYSNYSPCDQFARFPPIVVDQRGNYYGKLVVSGYHSGIVDSPTIRAWLAGACAAQ